VPNKSQGFNGEEMMTPSRQGTHLRTRTRRISSSAGLSGDNRQLFDLPLGDQQPIEWIAMVAS
jgi:hypothetical protein